MAEAPDRCEMELCPLWGGDGRVCPCAVLAAIEITPPGTPVRGNAGFDAFLLAKYGNGFAAASAAWDVFAPVDPPEPDHDVT